MSIVGYGQRELYAGLFAKDNRGILDINSPIQDGIITDWEAMEEIWYHMFYEELLIPPEKYPILLTEPVGNPTSCQEKLVEVKHFKYVLLSIFYAMASWSGCFTSSIHLFSIDSCIIIVFGFGAVI